MSYYHKRITGYADSNTRLHENIHQIRLCFKRLRSILRLFRPGMQHTSYQQWNVYYRDLSRTLSHMRDFTARIEVVDDFLKDRRSPQNHKLLSRYKSVLAHRRREYFQHNDPRQILQHISKSLLVQHATLLSIHLEGEAEQVFVKGFSRVYKQAQKFYTACQRQKDDHVMHQWRKQVKYLWYQLAYLTPLWPGLLKAWAGEFQSLSKILGAQHDRVIMAAHLREDEIWFSKDKHFALSILNSCRRQKEKLSQQALCEAHRLFVPTHAFDAMLQINP